MSSQLSRALNKVQESWPCAVYGCLVEAIRWLSAAAHALPLHVSADTTPSFSQSSPPASHPCPPGSFLLSTTRLALTQQVFNVS